MDGRYEYPLPVLSLSTDGLIIETKDRYEGSFKIKNTGGSTLCGHILSRSRSLTFEPERWEGNETDITYRFTPEPSDGWKPGDVLDTCAIICSNGGEKKLPVTIKLTKMAIATAEGVTIANLRDFYHYAAAHPLSARRLFVDSEFYMLLLATGYEYMEAYEMLHKDLNRERALDNFFILSGLKKKTTFTLPKPHIAYTCQPYENAVIYDHFLVQKSDRGFLEIPVTPLRREPWLSLSVDKLITADFNEAGTAMVKYSIDPLQVKGRYASETLLLGTEPDSFNQVELVFKRTQPLAIRLKREGYRYEDHGIIEVINHTGLTLNLELFCEEHYVRFGARRYPVAERAEIPFDIKLNALMTAQLLFRKLPFLRTAIEVRTAYHDTVIRKKLPITVGEW